MRKKVDRKLVHRKIKEILALRRWSDKRWDGSPIPGEAFGIGARCNTPVWQSDCMKSKDFDFAIRQDGEHLMLMVDAYTASGRGKQAGSAWDVDQWEAEKIFIVGDLNRDGFRSLSRIGRLLVQDRHVTLGDGTLVPGIGKERGGHA